MTKKQTTANLSRFERGQIIAASSQIRKVQEIPSSIAGPLTVWTVASERIQDKFYYVVEKDSGPICSCPDFTIRGETCKHCFAVIQWSICWDMYYKETA